jgi:hypothetical protein
MKHNYLQISHIYSFRLTRRVICLVARQDPFRGGILFFATIYLELLQFALLYIVLYLLPHITLHLNHLPLLDCLVYF